MTSILAFPALPRGENSPNWGIDCPEIYEKPGRGVALQENGEILSLKPAGGVYGNKIVTTSVENCWDSLI
jgi:hypothetical protein